MLKTTKHFYAFPLSSNKLENPEKIYPIKSLFNIGSGYVYQTLSSFSVKWVSPFIILRLTIKPP